MDQRECRYIEVSDYRGFTVCAVEGDNDSRVSCVPVVCTCSPIGAIDSSTSDTLSVQN